MKKTASQDVFLLVKSLDSNEKSHFKKSLSKRSDGKLAKVFDIIAKLDNYEVETLRIKVGAVYTNHTEAYRQLTQAILKSLTTYHTKKSAFAELNTLLSQIAITREKKLFTLCDNLIEKGLKVASENNLYNYQGMLWSWRSKVPPEPPHTPVEWQEETHNQMVKASELALRSVHQSLLHYKLGSFSQAEYVTRRGLQQLFDEIISHELLEESNLLETESEMLDVHAKNLINGAHFYYGDLVMALQGCERLIESLGPVEKLADRMFYNWAAIHGNMLELSLRLYDRPTFEQTRQRLLDSVELRNARKEDIAHTNLELADVKHLVNLGELDRSITELKGLLKVENTTEYGFSAHDQLVKLNILWVLFVKGEFQKAIAEINSNLTNKDFISNNQRVLETRWLEVLCAYNLGDPDLFESRLLSFKRFLKSIDSGFEWENDILNTLDHAFGQNQKERPTSFSDLFEKIKPHRFEFHAALPDIHLLTWISSIASNRSMIEVMKEKYAG